MARLRTKWTLSLRRVVPSVKMAAELFAKRHAFLYLISKRHMQKVNAGNASAAGLSKQYEAQLC